MKATEFRKLIREEVKKAIPEISKMELEPYDPDLLGPEIVKAAEQLADEYTNGQFKRYSGFYNLEKLTIQIYK